LVVLELGYVRNLTAIGYHAEQPECQLVVQIKRSSLLSVDLTPGLPLLLPLYPIIVNLLDLLIVEWSDRRDTVLSSIR
jgi:hypothetical protein